MIKKFGTIQAIIDHLKGSTQPPLLPKEEELELRNTSVASAPASEVSHNEESEHSIGIFLDRDFEVFLDEPFSYFFKSEEMPLLE